MDYPDWDLNWEDAIRSRNLLKVKNEIKKNIDVNMDMGNYRDTALHIACMFGDIDIIDLLIQHGANVNQKNKSMGTPLHNAAMFRNYDAVDLLIKHGALKNELTKWGDSAIGHCLNNPTMVRFLIEHGCSVFTKGPHEFSLLSEAIDIGNIKTVRLLLHQGMDPRCIGPRGQDAYHRLRFVKDDIADLLLKAAWELDEAENKLKMSVCKRECECVDGTRRLQTKRLHENYEQ